VWVYLQKKLARKDDSGFIWFSLLFYDFDDRKQSWAYEPRQGLGDLWRVYRHTSDVENGSFLSSNCSKH
jgi:hypothetical protein